MIQFQSITYWVARLAAALIMLQTLYFKFTGAEESVYIFTTIGMEPWGRITVGGFELIAAVLLMINRWAWIGGALGLGLMVGAIGMHLTQLGIVVMDDSGYLFTLACVVALSSLYVLYVNKDKLRAVIHQLKRS